MNVYGTRLNGAKPTQMRTFYYTMDRKGIFQSKRKTSNQCKDTGHMNYDYQCKIAFADTKLDGNGFLIEHAEIDAAIQHADTTGSCEQMHMIMMNTILDLFSKKKIKVVAVQLKIKPIYPEGMAYLTYTYAKSSIYLPLVTN